MIAQLARGIFAKELKQLAPIIIGLSVLVLLRTIPILLGESPDRLPWYSWSFLMQPGSADFSCLVVLCASLIAAHMLFPREQDDRTLEFLWALPVRRWVWFAAKVAVAYCILCMFWLAEQAIGWIFQYFDTSSITRDDPKVQIWWTELVMMFGATAIGLGYGMLSSFFRVAGVLAVFTLWTIGQVIATVSPELGYVHITGLFTAEVQGTSLIYPYETWAFHAIGSLTALVTAARLWTSRADSYARFHARTRKAVVPILASIFVVFLVVASVVYFQRSIGDAGTDASNPSTYTTTEHYRIQFYQADTERVTERLRGVDDIHRELTALLGAAPTGTVIADISSIGPDHLGIAGWRRIRIERKSLADADEFDHVIAHETVHVIAANESDRRLNDHMGEANFFSEGLAEWATYELIGLDETRSSLRILAAAAWRRFELKFDDLMNQAAFNARFDMALTYAIGELWVDALARQCGVRAPGDALRAMGRDGAPRNLRGRRFWEDTLQAIGCDVNAVNATFEQRIAALAEASDVIPRLTAAVRVLDRRIAFDVTLAGGDPETAYVVRVNVRDGPGAATSSYMSDESRVVPGTSTQLEVSSAAIAGERFQYQLGVIFAQGERPYFERWQWMGLDAGQTPGETKGEETQGQEPQ